MKLFAKVFFAFALLISNAIAQTEVQTVTLYPPRDKVTGKYDESRACFDFKSGALKTGRYWTLGYGFMAISNQDWFILQSSSQSRSVIKDLGELKWEDSFEIPALEPLPVLPAGERRSVVIDSSADTHKQWASETRIHAKVAAGHIYLIRVKDDESDFYVLFRVEEFKRQERCAISWKRIQSPEK
ncbi:MAG: hypothetical protein AB1631_28610 [Acidobacteriota bacterium]